MVRIMLISKPDFLPLVLAIFAKLNSTLNHVSVNNIGTADRDSVVSETFTYASLCNTDPIPSLHAVQPSVCSSKKKASFWNFLESVSCDIICGCETWLNPTIYDAEVLPTNINYTIHRKDRPDSYRGSLILIKDNIVSEPVEVNTPCDILFQKIKCINKETLIIGSAYRPTNNDEEYSRHLFKAISHICNKFKNATIWIAGDFNLPDINWSNNAINGHQYRKAINEQFLLLEPELGFTQIVDFPTRGDNILDLFLTNRPQLVNRCTTTQGISDHHAIFVDTNMCATRIKPTKHTLYMWGKANINTIKEKSKALSDTLQEKINPSSDINYILTFFKNGCQKIIEDEVPHRQSAQRFNQPWINRDIRRITRLKRRWFRRAKNSNSTSDWSKYKDIKRKAQRLSRSVHDAHISDMLQPDH
ncbi:uncharacterized protein LOC132726133 [Ruditapes philippinarum]|uniref:uncharacterized protein LOC132726133 n=1 Tax=Ruditapes philippinarum TaxID=129788 RepID=UPI00295C0E64|nr:uncharacterized protein LOC132726133 [Ruditapes philippinarum]